VDVPELQHSVVIPTYQRRELVTAAVDALAALDEPPLEVIVVVDGSTDGTAQALAALQTPFPLRVVEQPNAGASRARNHGAGLAQGELLLFLDDDMIAAPGLLAELRRCHENGADAVLGHIPVWPDGPRTFLSRGLDRWAADRRRRLIDNGGQLTSNDLLTGQLSVRRAVFESLGGFDERFTRDGTFGREDTDFGRRLIDEGHHAVFAPEAVSFQRYEVSPRAYLRQWHDAGRSDVAYVRKHPSERQRVYESMRPRSRSNRFVVRPLARAPGVQVVVALARRVAVTLAARRPDDDRVARIFFKVRNLEYWRAVNEAGGLPAARPFRVLCYHAVRDLAGARRVEQYGIPARLFAAQLRMLRRVGFRFVSLDEVLRAVAGTGGLPRRALLITFDDCYTDLLDDAVPALEALGVPAAAFAVSDRVGATNTWDTEIGAPELPLLDAAGLRAVHARGVEIGVHGATHRPLTDVGPDDLADETAGAVAEFAARGLPPPRAFAYPHGAHDAAARCAVAAAGLAAAFTVTPGLVRPGRTDPMQVPRIEVLRRDGAGLRLLAKVALAGRIRPRS
jgi:Predicted glycosyltransferases